MKLDNFIALLDVVNKADSIHEVVTLLTEIDIMKNLDNKEREVLDECLTESVQYCIMKEQWSGCLVTRYGDTKNAAVSADVFTDATPENIIVNGFPMEVYRGK